MSLQEEGTTKAQNDETASIQTTYQAYSNTWIGMFSIQHNKMQMY